MSCRFATKSGIRKLRADFATEAAELHMELHIPIQGQTRWLAKMMLLGLALLGAVVENTGH